MSEVLYGLILPVILWGLLVYYGILVIVKMQKLAKKLGIQKHLWLMWLPGLNYYLIYQMSGAKKLTLWTLGLLVILSGFLSGGSAFMFTFNFIIISAYVFPGVWCWKIATKLGYPGWWGVVWPLWLGILEVETQE